MKWNGHVRLYRDEIEDDPVGFQKPFTNSEAWQWLKAQGRWENSKTTVMRKSGKKTVAVEIGFGDVPHSQRYLAKEWGWDRSRVRRFLDNLEQTGKIHLKQRDPQSDPQKTRNPNVISICEFNRYSGDR